MTKKSKKIIIFSLFFFLSFLASQSLGQRELEVEYPEIQGLKPETTAVSLPEYVRYIFNFTIAIIGLIGFGALIIGGIRYLTSAGNSEKIKNAKKQIKYAFLGMLILLFSYLILTTINPQLVIFRLPAVEPASRAELPGLPISEEPSLDLLTRIGELAQAVKIKADEMKNTTEALTNLINNCDCNTAQPLCLCKSYYGGCASDNVNPCYSALTTQPCPDDAAIKSYQLTIASSTDGLLYLKNRVLAEREDLIEDLEIINKKIEWYTNKITAETKVLNQLPEGAEKELQQEIIEILKEEKAKLETEKGYKEDLAGKEGSKGKLQELANAIEELKEPGKKISELPDECLTNVPKKCQGSCRGGCHDTLGCFPVSCSGGNPCPTEEIQTQVNNIDSAVQEIKKIADEIIEIVGEITTYQPAEITTPATTTPATTTPATATCQTPDKLAEENNVPYPAKRAASLETLLNCISSQTKQTLPSENGSNQFYGSLYTYEHTNELCNYTRGKTTCGNCAHILYSCHYGGSNGSDGALAIDIGNEDNGDRIIAAALSCGAKSGRCESDVGKTVNCSDSSAHHIHINDKNCDKN